VDNLLHALMASLADAVYLVGAEGEVQFANPAAVAILGYEDAAELIGRDSHATIHSRRPTGEPYPEDECPLLRPRVTGEAVRVALDWFVRRDGTFVPVSYASAPVEGRGAVVVFRDESSASPPRRSRDRARGSSRRAMLSGAASAATFTTARSSGSCAC
jgi:PAS domain S-box-containing protein